MNDRKPKPRPDFAKVAKKMAKYSNLAIFPRYLELQLEIQLHRSVKLGELTEGLHWYDTVDIGSHQGRSISSAPGTEGSGTFSKCGSSERQKLLEEAEPLLKSYCENK
jgi:hypothetical protein